MVLTKATSVRRIMSVKDGSIHPHYLRFASMYPRCNAFSITFSFLLALSFLRLSDSTLTVAQSTKFSVPYMFNEFCEVSRLSDSTCRSKSRFRPIRILLPSRTHVIDQRRQPSAIRVNSADAPVRDQAIVAGR